MYIMYFSLQEMIKRSLPYVTSFDAVFVVEFQYVCENGENCGVCSGRYEWVQGTFKEILDELFSGYSVDSCEIIDFKFSESVNDVLTVKYVYNSK